MTRRDYIFMSDEHAERITREYSTNEAYLRSLVSNLNNDGAYADSLTFGQLKHEGKLILSIAKRRVESLKRAKMTENKPVYREPARIDGQLEFKFD